MPAPLETDGFEWFSVYLSKPEVVFLTKAPEPSSSCREIRDDPVCATEVSPWLPLFDDRFTAPSRSTTGRLANSASRLNRTNRVTTSRPTVRDAPETYELKERAMIDRILYTAEATAEGGREGHARTSDGRLDVGLDVPTEMGGPGGPGTNPEQLFAAGYAACFQSSMARFAAGWNLDLTGSRVTARVGIGPAREGGLGLVAALDLNAPGIDRAKAVELMTRAHETCPYSRATRGNIDVTLSDAGVPIESAAA